MPKDARIDLIVPTLIFRKMQLKKSTYIELGVFVCAGAARIV